MIYSIGEPIKLQLKVTNNTGDRYSIDRQPASGLTELQVRDENGSIIPPSAAGRVSGRGFMVGYDLAPGASVVPRFSPPDGSAPVQWQDITWWRYNITKPGTYTIVAVPKFRGFQHSSGPARPFVVSESDTSSPIRIQIVP
jgi:hypothetical protein